MDSTLIFARRAAERALLQWHSANVRAVPCGFSPPHAALLCCAVGHACLADVALREGRDRVTAVLTAIEPLSWTRQVYNLAMPSTVPFIFTAGNDSRIPKVRLGAVPPGDLDAILYRHVGTL